MKHKVKQPIRGKGGLIAALALAIAAFLAFAAPALAAGVHAYTGESITAGAGTLHEPTGMNFDSEGNLFLAQAGNGAIDKFDSTNAYEQQITGGDFFSPYRYDVAVNDTTGVVYVAESGYETIDVFKPEGGGYTLVEENTLGAPESGTETIGFLRVAVDNSSSAKSGDVYVTAQIGNEAHVFYFETGGNSEGKLENQQELSPAEAPNEEFLLVDQGNGEGGIAVDGRNGDVYLPENERNSVAVYTAAGVRKAAEITDSLGQPIGHSAFRPVDVAIDEASGEVFVVDREGIAGNAVDVFVENGGSFEYTGQLTGKTLEQPRAVAVQNAAVPTQANIYVSNSEEVAIFQGETPPLPQYPLHLSTSGGEGGTFACEVEGSPVDCGEEFEQDTVVTVTTTPNSGSVFSEWTGACTSSPCEVTMEEEESVVAHFNLASESFSATETGHGSVACEDSIEELGSCSGSFPYGDTITVVATPESGEYVLGTFTTSGSANGNCDAEAGTCSFAIHAPSTVTAEFESAGTKDEFDGNVHGEVKPATVLETADCEDVDLGVFIPGVAAAYPETCTVTSTSTGGETTLSAEDEESVPHKGYLENGEPGPGTPYYLEEPLEVGPAGGSLSALTSLTGVLLHTYTAPVYKVNQELEFSQQIKAGEALRTGVYAKTITVTLEQTTP